MSYRRCVGWLASWLIGRSGGDQRLLSSFADNNDSATLYVKSSLALKLSGSFVLFLLQFFIFFFNFFCSAVERHGNLAAYFVLHFVLF